jgi:hypothetical protein
MRARLLTNQLKTPDDPDWRVSRSELVLAWTKTY